MLRVSIFLILATCFAFLGNLRSTSSTNEVVGNKSTERFRPVASAFSEDENQLLVASKERGTVAVFNLESQEATLLGEFEIGKQLTQLEALGGDRYVTTDATSHDVILFSLVTSANQTDIKEIDRHSVCQFPHQIAILGKTENVKSSNKVAISGLWSQQISVVGFDDSGISSESRIDLDFAPGPLVWLNDSLLFIADAFSDQVALVDADQAVVVKTWRREGHRIGGISVAGDVVAVTDVKLSKIARSVTSDIHWGLLVSNDMIGFDRTSLINESELREVFQPLALGGPSDGKGDPTEVSCRADGAMICLLQGVGEIAVGDQTADGFVYIDVGDKPVGMQVNEAGTMAIVCNELSDTVGIVDFESERIKQTISLSNAMENKLGPTDRGELLFFDSSLSHDAWISCNTCHVNGHTSSLLNDNFSDQTFGTPKQIISLLGLANTLPLAWNGSMTSVENQVRASLKTTMRMDTTPEETDVSDLTAFINSFSAAPSILDSRELPSPAIRNRLERGKALFVDLKCVSCHVPEAYTIADVFDVSIHDELGATQFNPPSLRGASQRSRYFHDGKASSLAEVIGKFGHPKQEVELSEQDQADLVMFLKSL